MALVTDGAGGQLVGPDVRWADEAHELREPDQVGILRSRSDPAGGAGLYADAGQPLIFRVPTIATDLDDALSRERFGAPEAETITLHARLSPSHSSAMVDLTDTSSQEWLQVRAEMNGADATSSAIFATMLGLIGGATRFASVRDAGRIASIAYGVLSRDLLVIEAVATRPEMRGRGMARNAVAALMAWAAHAGTREACLQVVADNVAARRLYDGLGFTRELYRYHYRR